MHPEFRGRDDIPDDVRAVDIGVSTVAPVVRKRELALGKLPRRVDFRQRVTECLGCIRILQDLVDRLPGGRMTCHSPLPACITL